VREMLSFDADLNGRVGITSIVVMEETSGMQVLSAAEWDYVGI